MSAASAQPAHSLACSPRHTPHSPPPCHTLTTPHPHIPQEEELEAYTAQPCWQRWAPTRNNPTPSPRHTPTPPQPHHCTPSPPPQEEELEAYHDEAMLAAVGAHAGWLSFLSEQWTLTSGLGDTRAEAVRALYNRLLHYSLRDPAALSSHPAAIGARFRLLQLGLVYGRSVLARQALAADAAAAPGAGKGRARSGGAAAAGTAAEGEDGSVLLLFDKILRAALFWFKGTNRVCVCAGSRAVLGTFVCHGHDLCRGGPVSASTHAMQPALKPPAQRPAAYGMPPVCSQSAHPHICTCPHPVL